MTLTYYLISDTSVRTLNTCVQKGEKKTFSYSILTNWKLHIRLYISR